jgi:hypothetical protein
MKKLYLVNVEMLGSDATDAQAKRMVELLRARNYDVEYTADGGLVNDIPEGGSESDLVPVPDADWDTCLRLATMDAGSAVQTRGATKTLKTLTVDRRDTNTLNAGGPEAASIMQALRETANHISELEGGVTVEIYDADDVLIDAVKAWAFDPEEGLR